MFDRDKYLLDEVADVCLIVEGAYPYVAGGVSAWTQDLIQSQAHLRFHLLVIVAPNQELKPRYKLPANVCGLSHVLAAQIPLGDRFWRGGAELMERLTPPLVRLMAKGSAADLHEVIRLIAPFRHRLGRRLLLDSRAAWRAFNQVYAEMCDGASYLNAFWGFRTLLGGLFATLLPDLPPAFVYHTISTGYAGLVAARAAYETGRPAIVTEHGVYTNERRLEILAAPWLAVDDSKALSLHASANKVKELWINTFVSYSRACYETCNQVITLFEGNHALQLEDGAAPHSLAVIPNGIDLDKYARVQRIPRLQEGGTRKSAIALLGRVVPIKDVKTFIRACAILVRKFHDVDCLIVGPMEEDPPYAQSCKDLVKQLGLQDHVVFTGMANLLDYFGSIDVIALTSISEAQPLVILEGGAAGVPSVATDVGACREMIYGRSEEQPNLGVGGRVVPIGNPSATAEAMLELLQDEPLRAAAGLAMQQRVRNSYNKRALHQRYARLYDQLIATETVQEGAF